MAKKEINEKTFEVNITSELLNLSKSFMWYLKRSPIFNKIPEKVNIDFLNNTIFFAEGLTQQEEANVGNGGYDVSINFVDPKGIDKRLLFLQFKSGRRSKYSKLKGSKFEKSKTTDTQHVLFTFNDDSQNAQHSALRALAKKSDIKSESVMYVFPRITEKSDFNKKVGKLLDSTSFVPIKELDRQAKLKKIEIDDGNPHKFRVNYDGSKSEVNLLLLLLILDSGIVNNILSELICVQIERFLKSLQIENPGVFQETILAIRNAHEQFVIDYEGDGYVTDITKSNSQLIINVNNYLNLIEGSQFNIPSAPSNYSVVIPKEGLKIKFDKALDLSKISYQIF